VAIIDYNVGKGGGGEDLALIFETIIGLCDDDEEVARGMGLQVSVTGDEATMM